LVNEYLPIIKQHPALLDAYRAHAICMVNSFRSKIIHKKALFAVLTDARHAKLFTEEERAMITGHVPWTRQVRAAKVTTMATRSICWSSSARDVIAWC